MAPKAKAANCGEIDSIIADGPQQVAQASTLWNVPLIVITAGQHLRRSTLLPDRNGAGDVWKAIQANTAHISSRGEQVFATKSSHFVQQDEEGVGVMQVCQLFDEVARPNEAKQSGDGRIQPRSGNSRVRPSFRFAGGALPVNAALSASFGMRTANRPREGDLPLSDGRRFLLLDCNRRDGRVVP